MYSTAYVLHLTLQELPKVIARFHSDAVEMEKTAALVNTQVVMISRVLDSDQVRVY